MDYAGALGAKIEGEPEALEQKERSDNVQELRASSVGLRIVSKKSDPEPGREGQYQADTSGQCCRECTAGPAIDSTVSTGDRDTSVPTLKISAKSSRRRRSAETLSCST